MKFINTSIDCLQLSFRIEHLLGYSDMKYVLFCTPPIKFGPQKIPVEILCGGGKQKAFCFPLCIP